MKERIDKLRGCLQDGQALYITSYANIFYYSGFTSEDAALLITSEDALLLTDARYTIQAAQQCPLFTVVDISRGLPHIISSIHAERIGYEENALTVSEYERLVYASEGKELVKSQQTISYPRQNKDAAEIAKIREAECLGDMAFSYILEKIRPGMTELEIAVELEFFMRRNGAQKLSFDTIAASGKRSSMPHGTASDKCIERGDFLTLDFGCVLDGYCSDMTRTVVIGNADSRQREIYDVVLDAQQLAISAIHPGIRCCDIDKIARDRICDAGYGACFGHSLGHSVGIDIHEAPSFSPKCDQLIENGHVITVEPGIYIEDFGGVRIEDVIAVYNDQAENLTHSPKKLIEIL